jgi:phosphomannomutase
MKISVQVLMETCGVKFGTSGARGLAEEMSDFVCCVYTKGFLGHLAATGAMRPGMRVAVAGDLRPSTGRIMAAVMRAVQDSGGVPVNCGRVPSPAVALYGLEEGIPAIMVTGSHIPDDRNGIKFNKPTGEILKEDEEGIRRQVVEVDKDLFGSAGNFKPGQAVTAGTAQQDPATAGPTGEAAERYVRRYVEGFGPQALAGVRLGVYQHSAVGRELLVRIFEGLGARVTPLGFSEKFIPVDTEAIRPEDVALAAEWAGTGEFDAIISTDGDSDRPLISDERGQWLRGDVAGILCARHLGADAVCTPVSCNSAVERCGWFPGVRRTRIGSPYVIAAMLEATEQGARRVVGYEANGGFLLNSDLELDGRRLRALPTRDAVLPQVSLLLLARREGRTLSGLVATLPARFTASDRLKDFAVERSQAILARFAQGNTALEEAFGKWCGRVAAIDRTDGVRVTFDSGEVVHLRPSGNAPEFRCYNEAATAARAEELNRLCLERLRQMA